MSRREAAKETIWDFHGLVMNGGIAHALEVDFEQARCAAEDFRLFGADDAANIIDSACDLVERLHRTGGFDPLDLNGDELEALEQLNQKYNARFRRDESLAELLQPTEAARPKGGETVSELAAAYRLALEEVAATFPKKVAKHNRAVDKSHAFVLRLRETPAGRAEVEKLFAHPEVKVRLYAATDALQWNPKRAASVLREVAKTAGGLHAFEAEMTLREFEAGRLKWDW